LLCNYFAEEDITVHSLRLLNESELQSLGFKLGDRKLLMLWILEQKENTGSLDV